MTEQAPPPPESEDDLPEFEDRAKPFLLKCGAVLLVILVVAFGAKPLSHSFKKQRGIAAAEQVEAMMLQDRRDEASAALKVALELAPKEPRVLRLAARYCSRFGIPEGINYWQMLLATPEAARDDRLKYLEFALAQGRLDIAAKELEGMLKFNPRDPEAQRLLIRLHLIKDDRPAAVAVARQMLKDAPADNDVQLLVGQLLTRDPLPAPRSDGRRLLWALAVTDNRVRDQAVDLLVSDRELPRAESELLLRAIESRNGNLLVDRLKAAGLRTRLEPGRKNEIALELVRNVGPNPSADDLLTLAVWLELQGEASAIVDLLTPERAQGDGRLLALRLQALVTLGRTAEAAPALADSKSALEPVTREMLRASVAAKESRLSEVTASLARAIEACAGASQRLLAVAIHAERLGDLEAAVAAHERLLDNPGLGATSAREIFRLLDSYPDLRRLQATIRRLAEKVPGFKSLAGEEAYVSLLLGERVGEARNTLTSLLAQDPKNQRLRVALALAQLRNENAAEALTLLEAERIDWAKAPARWQAVQVAVLGGNGRNDAARELAGRIDTSKLKDQERELIRPWL